MLIGYTRKKGGFRVPIQYLVPCSCGRKIAAETRQAGETIICGCGERLIIPRLLELKKLEKVAVPTSQAKSSSVWGIGQSLILSGAVVLVAVVVLWILVLKKTPGDPYEGMTPDQIRAQFQKMSPSDTLKTWMYFKQIGLNPHKDYLERRLEGLFAQRQMLLLYLGIAAAIGVALIATGIIIVRRKRPKRSNPPSS
jgi:hypothetical protein